MKTNLLIGNRNACGFDGNSSWLAGTLPLIRNRGLASLGKTSRRFVSSVMLAAAFAAAQVQAQIVYDATADFSIANGNPNGAWSYGWMSLYPWREVCSSWIWLGRGDRGLIAEG